MAAMPLTHVPPGRLRQVVVPALAVYALAWLPFLLVGEPGELVRLQQAGSEAEAARIVGGWTPAETRDLALLLGIDHVHLLAYGVLLAAGAVWSGRRLRGRAARWAPWVAWLAVAAAAFDVGENVGTALMLRGDLDAPVPALTGALALAKYTAFGLVLAYVAAGAVARWRRAQPS